MEKNWHQKGKEKLDDIREGYQWTLINGREIDSVEKRIKKHLQNGEP